MEFLKLLSETPGVPGREERVREVIAREIEGLFDETRVDAMGNLVCIKRATRAAGKGPAQKFWNPSAGCLYDVLGDDGKPKSTKKSGI